VSDASCSDKELPPVAHFRAADGMWVVEVDLRRGGGAGLLGVVELARREGAGAVWAHAAVIDAELGFRKRGGYARLEAERVPASVALPVIPGRHLQALQPACFAGVWGHPDPAEELEPDASVVGLYESGSWVGMCAVDVEERWIDGPGLLPGFRTPDRYARLVQGAATLAGLGPLTLESWGDSAETLGAYCELGFVLAEYVQGWELVL
jgi:hypothetical protein